MDIEIIGVYTVANHSKVHLIELNIKANSSDIAIGEFTQRLPGQDPLDGQAPWDERFLNADGTQIIGDYFNPPKETTKSTRLAFFLHDIHFEIPLSTPSGNLTLPKPQQMPKRIASILEYEAPY